MRTSAWVVEKSWRVFFHWLAAGSVALAASVPLAQPLITSPPRAVETVVGGRAVFAVVAKGEGALEYQWNKAGVPVPGASTEVLTISDVQAHDVGLYSVRVKDSSGRSAMAEAVLMLRPTRPGDLDFHFAHESEIGHAVLGMALQADGRLLLCGRFQTVHQAVRGRVARVHPDGRCDFTFGQGLDGANAEVRVMRVQADGRILIGGAFTLVNGATRKGLARLNPDGSLDAGYWDGLAGVGRDPEGALALVKAMATAPEGRLFIAGVFDSVHGVSRHGIARLQGDGTLDGTFGDVGILAGNTVSCLAVQADGRVLVGGNFSFVPGVVPGGLVRLHPDGATDPAFLDGMQGVEGTVNTLAIQADGRILVGGSFVRVNGEERRRVARLEADGRLDPDFLPGASGPDGEVSVIGLEPDGQIVIGGSFSAVGASTRKGLARLQADGSVDVTYREGASGYSGSVYALARDVEGRLITGGEFVSVDGVQQRRLARLDAKGVWDPTFRHGVSAIYGTAVDVVQLGDGSVMVAGLISLTNGTAFLARFDVGGSLDIDFRLGLRTTGLDDFNLALQPDGRLIVTGPSFTQPSPLGRVFRLASDLTFDAGFMSGLAGPDGNVRAAVFGLDGKVLLGGSFQKVNGTSRKRIACLNPDGSLDGGFLNGLGGADATVHAMAIQPDGRVLLGGQFRTVNGVARGRVARLLPDGSLDTGFLDGLGGADTNVFALALQADGKVLVGGDFTTMNGQARNRLARLHADGTLDESFLQGLSGVDGRVEEMMVQPDGCVVIVGRFAVCHGVQRRGVARLGPDGRLDAGFVCDVNGDPPWVAGVARQRDGDLLIAGGFSIVNGEPAACVARVYGGPAARPVILKQQVLADGSGIRVEFVGVRGVPHRVWRSADLRSWEEAGPATEVTPGGFEYRDVEGAGSAARFYRTGY